jgi:hypothetical protein
MSVEEEATGARNAHLYRDYAGGLGYTHIEVLNWSSSAGDWQFLISKDGNAWQIMEQTNNWPYAGFTYSIDEQLRYGSLEEVYQLIEQEF